MVTTQPQTPKAIRLCQQILPCAFNSVCAAFAQRVRPHKLASSHCSSAPYLVQVTPPVRKTVAHSSESARPSASAKRVSMLAASRVASLAVRALIPRLPHAVLQDLRPAIADGLLPQTLVHPRQEVSHSLPHMCRPLQDAVLSSLVTCLPTTRTSRNLLC